MLLRNQCRHKVMFNYRSVHSTNLISLPVLPPTRPKAFEVDCASFVMDEFAELVTLLRPSVALDTWADACSFAFEAVSAAVDAYRGFVVCRRDLDCLKRRALETGERAADMIGAGDQNSRTAGVELPPVI